MVAIVTLSVDLLTVIVGEIVWKLRAICMSSQSFLPIWPPDFRRPTTETGRAQGKGRTQK
jgi:hypothetical protein